MIFDTASLRGTSRTGSRSFRRGALSVVALGLAIGLHLGVPSASAQTLLDLQGQIEAATQSLPQQSPFQGGDGSEGNGLNPNAPDRAAAEEQQADETNATDEDGDDQSDTQRLGRFAAPSSIERDYAQRTGSTLRQYGYGTFARGYRTPLTSGEISPDYVLGIGDELVVTYRGQMSRTVSAVVNRDGDVILPDIAPLRAVGLTIGDLRDRLREETRRSMTGTEVFVSVGNIRLINVAVLGEVRRPGTLSLNSFSTVVDALTAANGIRRTGSLRRLELVRADGTRLPIDLYQYLTGGASAAQTVLRDGDRIVVPLIGATVAVDGDVARPGIFETSPGQSSMAMDDALRLAGGPLRPAGNRLMHISFGPDGVQTVNTTNGRTGSLKRGEILQVFIDRNVVGGTAVVEGSVSTPGPRALDSRGSLKSLLANIDLLSGSPYLPFGVVLTREPSTLLPRMVPVDLVSVLNGTQDMTLNSGDRFLILGAQDIAFLSSPAVAEALAGGDPAGCQATSYLRSIARRSQADSFISARQFLMQSGTPSNAPAKVACAPSLEQYPALLPLMLENVSAIAGDVRRPGLYPIVQPVSLRLMLNAAGGLGRSADISRVEITRYDAAVGATTTDITRESLDLTKVSLDSVVVRPGDMVRIATRVTTRERGLVTVRGEVLRPGNYDIRRGERLSEVLARAGGLSAEAYPFGAVFTRDRVRELERQANRRTASELQKGIVSLLARQSQRSTTGTGVADAMGVMRDLVKDLATVEPYGRVVVEADPAVLAARPELDTVMEGGDEIVIPKRPNYVLVVGEVLNPGAQQFLSGQRAADYVNAAGGYAIDSDEGRAFIVLPNGAAEPLNLGSWSTADTNVPPGAMIVIPRDLAPFDFLAVTSDVTRILGSLALTAAALNAIQD
ncbi:SLBB domain-containing protein [Tistrella mobilis]|uniref:polysaccharide biosynthesis/export family protein n=1 Tax=Tistrella mobilis TaxID=171437 RepID=UPI003556C309